MTNEVLTWTITPSERRKQVKEFISRAWLILIVLAVSFLFYYRRNLSSRILYEEINPITLGLYTAIGIIALTCLVLLLNKIVPYKLRTYRLDSSGITISKGKKKKYFSWKEFECFYLYQVSRVSSNHPRKLYQSYSNYPEEYMSEESMRTQLLETEQQIEGQIFYLKKKSSGFFSKFYKVFVVVYSKPNNSKAVARFLSNHLPSRKMTLSTDLGLVFYQFK